MPNTACRTLGRILTDLGTATASEAVFVVGLACVINTALLDVAATMHAK